jgi:hypothetical protein
MFNQLNKVNEEIIDWVEDYERWVQSWLHDMYVTNLVPLI